MDDLMRQVEHAVRAALVAVHAQRGDMQPLAADPLVFDSGLLDSLGLAELVVTVERCTGHHVDMLRFDPLAVSTASDLVRELGQALRQTAGA